MVVVRFLTMTLSVCRCCWLNLVEFRRFRFVVALHFKIIFSEEDFAFPMTGAGTAFAVDGRDLSADFMAVTLADEVWSNAAAAADFLVETQAPTAAVDAADRLVVTVNVVVWSPAARRPFNLWA